MRMQIVIIIRGKSGATPLQRLEKLLSRQLFQKLSSQREDVLARITVLDAQICAANCGINAEDFPTLTKCAPLMKYKRQMHALHSEGLIAVRILQGIDINCSHICCDEDEDSIKQDIHI